MNNPIKDGIDLAGSTIEAIASSPKVATTVATATASIGAATKLELIKGVLSIASMTIALLTALVVLTYQLIKLARYWRAPADQPEPKDPA